MRVATWSEIIAAIAAVLAYFLAYASSESKAFGIIAGIIVYLIVWYFVNKLETAANRKYNQIIDNATEKFRQNSGYGTPRIQNQYNNTSGYSSSSYSSPHISTLGDGSMLKKYEDSKRKEVKEVGYTWEKRQILKEFYGNDSDDFWRCGNCKSTNNTMIEKCPSCGLSRISSDALIIRNHKKQEEEAKKKALEEEKARKNSEPYAWYYDHNGKIFYADRLGRAHYPDPAPVEESVPASEPEQIYEPEPISEQQQTFEPEPVSEPLQTYEYITAYEPQQTNMPEQATTPTETEQSQQEERPQLMFCPFCGNPAGAGQNFCAYCGSDISPYFNH
ncbi:MAG: hypothetical protein K5750_08965 [Eubacterium sp.]|nr:hypothetical protein [Eubacterium sp.]